ELTLDRGLLWYEPPESGTLPFSVRTGSVLLRGLDATFAVAVEADGTCFVIVVSGSVSVSGTDEGAVESMDAIAISASGRIVDRIPVSPEELAADTWVGANLPQPSTTCFEGPGAADRAYEAAALDLYLDQLHREIVIGSEALANLRERSEHLEAQLE